jgi:hypothetical protein
VNHLDVGMLVIETGEIMSQIDELTHGSCPDGKKGWDIRWLQAAGVFEL